MKVLAPIRVLLATLLLTGAAFACSVVEVPATVPRNVVVHVSRDGAPVPSADVVVASWTDVVTPHLILRTKTDAQGRARVEALPPGELAITSSLWPPFKWRIPIKVTVDESTTELQAAFSKDLDWPEPVELSTVTGLIVDPIGAVIPDSLIVLESADDPGTPVAATKADATGRFALDVVPGFYLMHVTHQGFKPVHLTILYRPRPQGWPGFRLKMAIGGCPSTGKVEIAPLEAKRSATDN